ncbi:sodium:proton antiporter NhaD, partial [Candidatus Berkelbacteria bacterium]|nr:sodium:proton antiporter NhaD [Candidatus Berkelbacteria bacterium]
HSGAEIFDLVIFLLAAMSLVEILIHYQFFDIIRAKLFKLGLTDRQQFVALAILVFFLSSIIDNLTATIVSIQISRKFFKDENLIKVAAGLVIAANAGGAFSPIGDVTTIMLWLADKFTAMQIIIQGFLPSVTLLLVALAILAPKIKNTGFDVKSEIVNKLGKSEWTIITTTFASFSLPLLMTFMDLPPYLGLLIGLGIVWILVDSFKRIRPKQTHLTASIEKLIKGTDIASLKFFVGILLAVGALNSLGILELLSESIYGLTPNLTRIIGGNIGLGVLSAVFDNIPLTAIAIDILDTTDPSLWVLLALTVGTGGSLLVIGSAAGVIAMGMVKELTFGRYLRYAMIPALFGFVAACGVWGVQHYLFFQ